MQGFPGRVVVLGTGGTIAGTADTPHDAVGYRAGQIGVASLVGALPGLEGLVLESEQVAQIDSKDIDAAVWQALARRVAHHLARDEVAGIVVTHGTDTLEETAWLLQRALAPRRPVVLTAAMRPATALLADGPQNLADAVAVAVGAAQDAGVVTVLAGAVIAAEDVHKTHGWKLDAFDAGDAGSLARIEQGALRRFRAWPPGVPLATAAVLGRDPADWPWVEVVHSHGGACGAGVQALVAAGVAGIVVAATGNGTVHQALAGALRQAAQQGVAVRLAGRCGGPLVEHDGFSGYGTLGVAKSRIELLLELMAQP